MLRGIRLVCVAMALGVCGAVALAQDSGATDILCSEAGQHVGEKVTIEATVMARKDNTTNTRRFVIEDNYGGRLVVQSEADWPQKDLHGVFTGIVTRDEVLAEPVLVELRRQGMASPSSEATPVAAALPTTVRRPASLSGLSPVVIVLFALSGLAFVALVASLAWLLTRRAPEPAVELAEGSTIRLARAPEEQVREGTVKVLPGRFVVVGGETSISEIRMQVSAANPEREFLIRRIPSAQRPRLNEIAFADDSVSSNQGKLLFHNGQYTIINYADPATRNPITINGVALGVNDSQILRDGDHVTLGRVELQFRAA